MIEATPRKKITVARLLTFGAIGLVIVLGMKIVPTLMDPAITKDNVEDYAAETSAGDQIGLKQSLDGHVLEVYDVFGGNCPEFSELEKFSKSFKVLSTTSYEPNLALARINFVEASQEIRQFNDVSQAEDYSKLLQTLSANKDCYYGETKAKPVTINEKFGINKEGFWVSGLIEAKPDTNPQNELVVTEIGLGVVRRGGTVMTFLGVTGGDPYDETIDKFLTFQDLETFAAPMIARFTH